jgi:hypothetical protein
VIEIRWKTPRLPPRRGTPPNGVPISTKLPTITGFGDLAQFLERTPP